MGRWIDEGMDSMSVPPRILKYERELKCAAELYDLDWIALAAIMERESEGGETLTPRGPSGTGDGGHGRGLMQIDDRWHPLFVASGLWRVPEFNVVYAARLLRDNLRALAGEYPAAIAAYNAGLGTIRRVIAEHAQHGGALAEQMDAVTTRRYCSGVTAIMIQFAA
jgi:soluble lytic murein transglycosylase-like protein